MTSAAIDIGNSRIKVGIFDGGALSRVYTMEDREGLLLFCEQLPQDTPVVVSNVTNTDLVPLHHYFTTFITLNPKSRLPVRNHYKTPETLGNDRLAAVAGAHSLYPGKNNLVIDIGTCIKYDLITGEGDYTGGQITPGIDMKFRALNHYTGKLPLVEKTGAFPEHGDSTENALMSGVMLGSLHEIQGFIDHYSGFHADLQVILTGGDHVYFVKRLKGTIFAEPELVLKGLFEILKYNAPGL